MAVQDEFIDFPDVVVGIGGAGKSVVYDALNTDWILEAGLDDQQGSGLFDAYVLDTDRSQRSTDLDQIDEISRRIEETAQALGQGGVSHRLEYLDLADAADAVANTDLLRQDQIAQQVIDSSGLSTWWLTADDTEWGLESFAHGTIRKRAIAKGLFHAAKARDGMDSLLSSLNAGEDAVIVAGLGGGTGSGVALDLAREAAAGASIHLLGLLPSRDSSSDALINAYTTLSELEYCFLTDRSPFESVVLVDPPGDDWSETTTVAVNALVGHANLSRGARRLNSSLDVGPPRHAPFTVATAGISQYTTPSIAESEAVFTQFLEDRTESLDHELQFYGALEAELPNYLDTYETGDTGVETVFDEGQPEHQNVVFSRLQDLEVFDLTERIEHVRSLLEDEVLGSVATGAIEDWLHWFDQLESSVTAPKSDLSPSEERRRKLRIIYDRDPDIAPEKYDDITSQKLTECLNSELAAIRARARLVASARLFEADRPQDLLRAILDREHGPIVPQLFDARDELRDRLDELSDRATTIEQTRDEVAHLVEDASHDWLADVHTDLEWVAAFESNYRRLEELHTALEEALERFAHDITQASSPENSPELEFTQFRELNDLRRELGMEPIDETRIRNNLEAVRAAREIYLSSEQAHLLKRWLRGDELRDQYHDAIRGIQDDLFEVEPNEPFESRFRCRFVGGFDASRVRDKYEKRIDRILTALDERREALRDELLDRVPDEVNGVRWPPDAERVGPELESAIQSLETDSDIESEIRTIAERRLRVQWVEPFDEALDATDDRLADLEQRLEFLRAVEEINQTHATEFTRRDEDHWEHIRSELDAVMSTDDTEIFRQLSPGSPERFVQASALADVELRDEDRAALEEALADSVFAQADRLPVVEETYHSEGQRVDHRRVESVFLSSGFEPGGPLDGLELSEVGGPLRQRFEADGDTYRSTALPGGPPWGVSAMTFVGGVSLDDLEPVAGSGGYKQAYERAVERADPPLLHHAYGLDGDDTRFVEEGDGMVVARQSLLDLTDERDLQLLRDPDVADSLLEDHYRFTPFHSSVTAGSEQ
ncbi:tubulin-like doman-containing protein [Halosimplex halophilum]|uniref:tubulin-like doman-containing protein n=1 Tax=Halosimplex halophilum TaxID=2559572 RepID=UPI00143544B1|nr:tubulin-like doman-containing protein [Halosimplex halophilum]